MGKYQKFGLFIIIFTTIIFLIVIVIFSIQNLGNVTISFLFWKVELSLATVIFLSLLIGIIFGIIMIELIRFKIGKKQLK